MSVTPSDTASARLSPEEVPYNLYSYQQEQNIDCRAQLPGRFPYIGHI